MGRVEKYVNYRMTVKWIVAKIGIFIKKVLKIFQ